MGWQSTFRALQAADRRQQREAQKRLRELERQAKERAKRSELEQARLEVDTFESRLEVLLSVHKEQEETWDWAAMAASLPPPAPRKSSRHEFAARNHLEAVSIGSPDPFRHSGSKDSTQGEAQQQRMLQEEQRTANTHLERRLNAEAVIEQARLQDEQDYQEALQGHARDRAEWERMRDVAQRILTGDQQAYLDALAEFSPFAEMSNLGSSIACKVHSPALVCCVLKVNGTQAIPPEVKSLTTSGKLSTKPMPRARFHELYQDYVCGCVLRVAREMFALLPAEALLITASADDLDSATGQAVEMPVLSVVMPRAAVARLDFDQLDPSDAVEGFQHRGDFKASRKTQAFQPIEPFTSDDIAPLGVARKCFTELVSEIRRAREELLAEIARLTPPESEPDEVNGITQ